MTYLDFSQKNSEEESRVIVGMYTGTDYKIIEMIAEDLGDFLFKLVCSQLKNQLR